jgi:hypothetical protein
MPLLKTKAPNVMRPAAGFHRDHAGRECIKKVQQSMPLQSFAKHDRNFDVHQMLSKYQC